jgi:hypothetical protein
VTWCPRASSWLTRRFVVRSGSRREVLAAISLLCYLLGIGSSTVVGLRSRRGAVAVLVWMSGSGETVAC